MEEHPDGIRYSAKRGSLDSDSPAAKCASANERLCSQGRLDDDGDDDDEFMTMIISGGVPLCRHRCLSFRRGDSGESGERERERKKARRMKNKWNLVC